MGLSKKIMAGLAAAATLLAGLAVGATAANAEGSAAPAAEALTNTQIRITASSADQFKTDNNGGIRTFKYAKLADYNFDKTTGKPYLETTDPNQKQTIISALKDAELTPDENMDPFTWLGSQSVTTITDAKWREFVENADLQKLATQEVIPTLDGTALTFDFTNTNPGGPGLYLIVDQTTPDPQFADPNPNKPGCTITYRKMQAILIGTKLDGVQNGTGELDIKGLVFGDLATGTAEQKQTGSENCLPKPGFTKVGDDGTTPLSGVGFSVYTAVDANSKTNDTDFKEGALKNSPSIDTQKFRPFNHFGTTDPKTNVLTSDDQGRVDFGTLTAGTYYVYESTMPTNPTDGKQYLADYRAVLKIEVFAGDQTKNAYYMVTDLNDHGLLTGDATSGYKYKNVTSIIHLPLTGAAGTALFVVVAVLLAGGAGVTFVRSRAVKRDLR